MLSALVFPAILSGCSIGQEDSVNQAISKACALFRPNGSFDISKLANEFGALARIAPQYQPIADTAIEVSEISRGGDYSYDTVKDFNAGISKLRAFCSGVN